MDWPKLPGSVDAARKDKHGPDRDLADAPARRLPHAWRTVSGAHEICMRTARVPYASVRII